MSAVYSHYLESLCTQRGWEDPIYKTLSQGSESFTCCVVVNGREYHTDVAHKSPAIAKENAAKNAFMICRSFSVNEGILARNGILQGTPSGETSTSSRIKETAYTQSGGKTTQSTKRLDLNSELSVSISNTAPYAFIPRPPQSTLASRRSPALSAFKRRLGQEKDRLKRLKICVSCHKHKVACEPSSDGQPCTRCRQQGYDCIPRGSELTPSQVYLPVALKNQDYTRTQWLLEDHFDTVATGEYTWLTELRRLGYSALEITDELMEKSLHGPWIFEPFELSVLPTMHPEYHQLGCVHTLTSAIDKSAPSSKYARTETEAEGPVLSTIQTIEYLCGVGGVRATPEGSNDTEFGIVSFYDNDTAAIITLIGPDDYSAVQEVLKNLESAAAVLQASEGCCCSFTFLYASPDHVEVFEVAFSSIRLLRDQLVQLHEQNQPQASTSPNTTISDIVMTIFEVLPFMVPHFHHTSLLYCEDVSLISHLVALAAQFLSLAFLSYTQAHCGSIQPFFLDKALASIALAGHGDASSTPALFRDFALYGTLVPLTCMGEMVDSPVFAFHSQEGVSTSGLRRLLDETYQPNRPKRDLVARPAEILDTWGPGRVFAQPGTRTKIYAIEVGGGYITATEKPTTDYQILHWSTLPGVIGSRISFLNWAKYRVGGGIHENPTCQVDSQARLLDVAFLLENLETYFPYWELAERQAGMGLQAGQGGVVALQFNQTWAKMGGITKKAAILRQKAVYIAELESYFGVQVSVCTGIARRVRLRDLLADIIPSYVDGIVSKPPLWTSLKDQHNVIEALRGQDLNSWLHNLDHDHQVAFETLAMSVLNLLDHTGIDRKRQYFAVACISPPLAFQCFKIPCKKESYWARLLADSEENATFAYVTTQCLETCSIKCDGPQSRWTNTAGLLGTSVSCPEDQLFSLKAVTMPNQWALKHSEAYLIGRPDSALFVEVDRPDTQADPRLLVSISTIPKEFLYRFSRKPGAGKPRRLREMKAKGEMAEGVVILVG